MNQNSKISSTPRDVLNGPSEALSGANSEEFLEVNGAKPLRATETSEASHQVERTRQMGVDCQMEVSQQAEIDHLAEGIQQREADRQGDVNHQMATAYQTEENHLDIEAEALQRVFDDIRTESANSQLVLPQRWSDQEFIPDHLTGQEFIDLVYSVLESNHRQQTPDTDNDIDTAEISEADDIIQSVEMQATDTASYAIEADGTTPATATQTAGGTTHTVKTQSHLIDTDTTETASPRTVLDALAAGTITIPTDDIASLEGRDTMYLYSTDHMTDTYAHWAFLAAEDDRVATFVDIVREESRTYPRPMVYRALANPPFNLSENDVLDVWKTIQETDSYPDIESCEASNGDVYFFSTTYLSRAYAESLAEYNSVERFLCP
ncbi:hypothetical protein [Cryptobacterium curtum]|uniref:hypothetical protein n=1 Tax=Cryptobacterium curtum TaxID=84163 RepID=UPI0028D5885A|nr:hypothetical protein [Cryptobacterium curtum]